jgi:organic radical activating enzyme
MTTYEKIESLVQSVRGCSLAELRAAALKILEGNPLFDIEAAAVCNATCSFCPRADLRRNSTIMTPKTFEFILKMLPDNAVVMFAGLGEPLLNKDLAIYISELKQKNISACIVTNGLLLNPQRQEQLIVSGVDQLQISYPCYSVSTNSCSQNQNIVDENLSYLAVNRLAQLRVQLNFVLTGENASELPKAIEQAKVWGFDLYVRRVHNRGGHYPIRVQEGEIDSSCGVFAAVTFIAADGRILSCSNNPTGEFAFKDVTDMDVKWQDIVAWKKQLLQQELPFKSCLQCNDDYRWLILDYLSTDICKDKSTA